MTATTIQPATTEQDFDAWLWSAPVKTDPMPGFDVQAWAAGFGEPHYITRNCCSACEAVIARADAATAMKDYCKGYINEAEMQAAQSYARYCATIAAEQAA